MLHVPKYSRLDIRLDGTQVVLIYNGQAILTLPWEAALETAKGINTQAKKAEQIAKATKIIGDQSVLMRSGVPIGLSDNPDIQKEAKKEAMWNTDLRRYLPNKMGNIASREAFGTPSLLQKPPKK